MSISNSKKVFNLKNQDTLKEIYFIQTLKENPSTAKTRSEIQA